MKIYDAYIQTYTFEVKHVVVFNILIGGGDNNFLNKQMDRQQSVVHFEILFEIDLNTVKKQIYNIILIG